MRGSVWTREQRHQPRETLSRRQVVRAAIDLLDAEGPAGLSMRKLAERLGAGATSIYWHVETKDDLLEYAIDEIYGEVDVPEAELAGWRSGVTLLAHSLRAAIVRHPWFSEIAGSRVSIGPNALSLSQRANRLFEAAGFATDDLERAQSALVAYVLGAAGAEAGWRAAVKTSGKTATEWSTEAYAQVLDAAGNGYPKLRERVEAWKSIDPFQALESAFVFGLECLLDGFQARL